MRHRICPTWNIHGDNRTEQGRPGHFILQYGWHWCMSCLSLTKLAGSTAVQSLPLPTAAIGVELRDVYLSSQCIRSISTSTPVGSIRHAPQADAKETGSIPILLHNINTPKHSNSAFHPQGPLLGGKEKKAWELSALHPASGWRSRGRVHHPQPFCWARGTSLLLLHSLALACCCCCSHCILTAWPPQQSPLCPQTPHHRDPCAPSTPAPSPLAVSVIVLPFCSLGFPSGSSTLTGHESVLETTWVSFS